MLKHHSIPCSRIFTVGDLVADEQFKALEILVDSPHRLIPNLQLVNLPVRIDAQTAHTKHGPPLLGEHSNQILSELGFSKSEIESLHEKDVIG
jgi:crotonobetainyl-CoA:carnitine CoA-transferase CaiB-like acyl-CoA transferase